MKLGKFGKCLTNTLFGRASKKTNPLRVPKINLSSAVVGENAPNGTTVAVLSVQSPLTGTYVFTLVDGGQSAAFTLSPNGSLVKSGDLNYAIRTTENLVVSASNGTGSIIIIPFIINIIDVANYPATGGAPSNIVLPTLNIAPTHGRPIAISVGSWSTSPNQYSYQWKLNGIPVAGATNSTYIPLYVDIGKLVTCTVTATNGGLTGSATTTDSAPILETILTSPFLTRNSASGVTPIDINILINLITTRVGDTVRLQISDTADFTTFQEETNVIEQVEVANLDMAFALLNTLPYSGINHIRARVEVNPTIFSLWSNELQTELVLPGYYPSTTQVNGLAQWGSNYGDTKNIDFKDGIAIIYVGLNNAASFANSTPKIDGVAMMPVAATEGGGYVTGIFALPVTAGVKSVQVNTSYQNDGPTAIFGTLVGYKLPIESHSYYFAPGYVNGPFIGDTNITVNTNNFALAFTSCSSGGDTLLNSTQLNTLYGYKISRITSSGFPQLNGNAGYAGIIAAVFPIV